MAAKSNDLSSVSYTPIPTQNVVVLSYYHHRPSRLRKFTVFLFGALILSVAVFFLYPSDPVLKLARLKLNHVRVQTSPKLSLDLSFSLTINVHNKDFFSLDYRSLEVSIGYRGKELGFVTSDGGVVRARGSSYVNATLDLDGLEVLHDVIYLIEDYGRGVIPFDTDSAVEGKLGVFFFKIPLKAKVSCEVYVNTNNQTIVRQDCYPK